MMQFNFKIYFLYPDHKNLQINVKHAMKIKRINHEGDGL